MNIFLPDFTKARILVLGDIMLDRYVWGTVDRISPEAPIPVVHIQDRTCRLGGAGNVAANLTGIGCQVVLAGILGQDPAGDEICELLASRGIENASVRSSVLPSVTKTRIMGGNQQVVRLDEERCAGINDTLRDNVFNKIEQELKQTDAVIISDYGKGLLTSYFLKKCITLAKAQDVPVFIDPKQDDWSAYAGVICITPNLKEFDRACQLMTIPSDPLKTAARKIMARYQLGHLLITRGSAGMSLYTRSGTSHSLPSQAREVFDVSGAGDTVIALIAAGYAVGCPMEQAMQLANLGAGEVVGRVGTYALTHADLKSAANAARESHPGLCDLPGAQSLVEQWRMLGQKIVFTNGCFDILHPGHISLLQRAKTLGDRLVVGLNTDRSINRIKGSLRPILAQEDRAAILSALNCVNLVVMFDEDTPINLLKALRPDILVKGGDYTPETVVGADLMLSWGGQVEVLSLFEDKSTSAIVDKIRRTHSELT